MERVQGPIDPCFLGERLDVEGLQREFANTGSLRFQEEEEEEEEEEETQLLMPSLEDKMPFLQMLQSVEYPPFFPIKEPNFQTLLKLQHLKKQQPWDMTTYITETETRHIQAAALEHESCVTHDIPDLHSPVKSESQDLRNPHSNSYLEEVSREADNQTVRVNSDSSSFPWTIQQTMLSDTHFSKSSPLLVPRERRKRKRTRPTKNKEEVESQRMTHIAVERNRRRQMNDHLNSLRSLMPPSYVQRGDQASIIGGAIDFVKELEQLLQSLEAQRRTRKPEEAEAGIGISSNGLFTLQSDCNGNCEEESKVKRISEVGEIEVTAVHNHVNLKIQCHRKPGLLLRAIFALEELRLSVLHLNITSSETTVLYSFNLKIEEDCKLGSADEVAATVNQIFSIINGS
ncbi:transcription factor bHLH67 [Ricinus communis]|uniref:transcription factor bHLH67 n=1 Tax=Ricinus communis TaxID=3988 RepID=UPI00201A5B9C|nr:transcription factor bHLH67 [Ricinus communis]